MKTKPPSKLPWRTRAQHTKRPKLPWPCALWRPDKKQPDAPEQPPKATLHLRKGQWAEEAACQHLEQHGLTVVERNFRAQCGELDLIMRYGALAVVVEVRLRSTRTHGCAVESVQSDKQARIKRCTQLWWQLRGHRQFEGVRFDVVGIDGNPSAHQLTWIKQAFTL